MLAIVSRIVQKTIVRRIFQLVQYKFDLIKVPTGGPYMIWVFQGKDNNFEANSGFKMHVLF